MHKIVFFRYLPLTKKIVEDFCMAELAEAGYCIEYWDITALFFLEKNNVEEYIPDDSNKIKILHIGKRSELKQIVKINKDALFICLMTFDYRLLFIFRYLTISNCKTAVFAFWPMPIASGETKKETIKRIRNYDFKRLCFGFLNRILLPAALYFRYINYYSYCFRGGEEGLKGIGFSNETYLNNLKMYDVNYWDYDKFIKKDLEVSREPYIVFLDEYYPFHPDGLMFGGSTVNADRYYDDMDSFFTAIEEFYGMPVVVAAHPKALKYKEHNYYNGRKVILNKTLELVSKSSLVLAHDSLSISFAIMCMKPLLFVNSHEIEKHLPNNYLEIIHFSKYMQSPMVFADNIDKSLFPRGLELTDGIEDLYKEMIEKYMSLVNPRQNNITLLLGYLDEIFEIRSKYGYVQKGR